MTIYVDFISTLKILGSIAAYTGGTNYAKYIVDALSKHKKETYQLKLLLPKNCEISEESNFFSSFDVIRVTDLLDVNYSIDDILYLPQVNGSLLMKLPQIKKRYPFLKIYGTLHDRQHNVVKYDNLDVFFEKGLKKYSFIFFIHYLIKKISFNLLFSHCVKSLDKVFTVSNYSMQLLNSPAIKFIKYYIQGNYTCSYTSSRGNYALFVGGNRGEKNMLRALMAFRKYKSSEKSSLNFICTGISVDLKSKISRKINLGDDIILKPYVSNEELAKLYANCKYVVFLSKAEGYGCPIREAMQYGKAVLASRTTSIPEVAGASIYYVDPFNIENIAKGMEYLDDEKNLDKYEGYILERRLLIERMAQQDLKIFINDFFE